MTTFLISCTQENDRKINPTQITTTDQMGNYTGTFDPSDWTTNDQWTNEESALFNFPDTLNTTGFQQGDSLVAAAFPNPASDVISFLFSSNKNTIVKMVITDAYLNTKWTHYAKIVKTIFPQAYLTINVNLSNFKKNTYYRLYYAFYTEGKVQYARGHGDFYIDK